MSPILLNETLNFSGLRFKWKSCDCGVSISPRLAEELVAANLLWCRVKILISVGKTDCHRKQIRLLLKDLGSKYFYKCSPNIRRPLGPFKEHHFFRQKQLWLLFGQHSEIIRQLSMRVLINLLRLLMRRFFIVSGQHEVSVRLSLLPSYRQIHN